MLHTLDRHRAEGHMSPAQVARHEEVRALAASRAQLFDDLCQRRFAIRTEAA